jgi:hypothetical protein
MSRPNGHTIGSVSFHGPNGVQPNGFGSILTKYEAARNFLGPRQPCLSHQHVLNIELYAYPFLYLPLRTWLSQLSHTHFVSCVYFSEPETGIWFNIFVLAI